MKNWILIFFLAISLNFIGAEEYIIQDSTETEARFTGVWARISTDRTSTEIIWFKDANTLYSFSSEGLVTKTQLKTHLGGEINLLTVMPLRNYSYCYRIENGKIYIWYNNPFTNSISNITGPHNYRFEGNKLYTGWEPFPERPFTKINLD